MPCDTMVRNAQERRLFDAAVEELAADLASGAKVIRRNAFTGEISISGWAQSAAKATGWCEGCALRTIESKGWATKSLKAAGITKKKFVVASHNGHGH